MRYYGKWMRDEAQKRIGHLYPKVQLPKEQGGGEALAYNALVASWQAIQQKAATQQDQPEQGRLI